MILFLFSLMTRISCKIQSWILNRQLKSCQEKYKFCMLEFLNLDNQYCIAQNRHGTHIKLEISKHIILVISRLLLQASTKFSHTNKTFAKLSSISTISGYHTCRLCCLFKSSLEMKKYWTCVTVSVIRH